MNTSGMTVLSLDDNKNNLLMIEAFTQAMGLKTDSFDDPVKGLDAAINGKYDLIIIDYMMPELNGLEVIKEFRKYNEETPIVMVTAAGDKEKLQLDALEAGASDFLNKPLGAAVFKARVNNLLKLRQSYKLLADKAVMLEEEVKKATEIIREREFESLKVLGKTSEYKDPETGAHLIRVGKYSRMIGSAYGLSKEQLELIFHSSQFHDIGKVGIPDNILLKPGKLNEEEFDVIKTHPVIGYNILKGSKSKYLVAGGIISLTHHEKFNGKGYPKKLKGTHIPLMGRIIAIADVFDALTSRRPYKEPWPIEKALNILTEEKGAHFDPDLVDLFIGNMNKVEEIFESCEKD